VTIAAMLTGPALQVRQMWSNWQKSSRLGIGGMVRIAFILAVLAAMLLIPLPCRVDAPMLLQPASAQGVYVTVDGELDWIAAPGTQVEQGEVIARLINPALEREMTRLEGELAQAAVLVTNLERRRLHDPLTALQLPAGQQTQADLTEQLQQRRGEAERLNLTAPQTGTLWPVQSRENVVATGQLGSWSATPFDAKNARCWLTAGTLIGEVGQDRRLEAVAYLAQRDVAAVTEGQVVRVQLDAAPGQVLSGTLHDVSAMQAEGLAESSAARLRLPIVHGPTGPRLVGTWYQARVSLSDDLVPALSHAGGTATIVVPPQSLAQRIGKWFQETFPGVW
jgi:hypothetical protein